MGKGVSLSLCLSLSLASARARALSRSLSIARSLARSIACLLARALALVRALSALRFRDAGVGMSSLLLCPLSPLVLPHSAARVYCRASKTSGRQQKTASDGNTAGRAIALRKSNQCESQRYLHRAVLVKLLYASKTCRGIEMGREREGGRERRNKQRRKKASRGKGERERAREQKSEGPVESPRVLS